MRIVHVSSFDIKPTIGAGRASYFWKQAFLNKGHEFIQVGFPEVGKIPHLLTFGYYAARYLHRNKIEPDIIIAHEQAAGFFINRFKAPVVLFSHGIEERCWEINEQYKFDHLSFKARLIPKTVRFYSNNRGFRYADLVMLSNMTDLNYLKVKYNIDEDKLIIFNNGYFNLNMWEKGIYTGEGKINLLFNASWVPRKGKDILIDALRQLINKGIINFQLTLAGVGDKVAVLNDIPAELHDHINIVERFDLKDEQFILKAADIFVLPSYYEGQSLALTQAMAASKCCLVSDNCGQIDFIHDRVNGLLFKTGSISSLSSSLEFIFSNSHLINQFGEAAYNSVKHLTWENVTNRIVERIEGLK